MKYLKDFSKNKKVYRNKTLHEVDVTTSNYMRGNYKELEVRVVDSLLNSMIVYSTSNKNHDKIEMLIHVEGKATRDWMR